MDSTFKIVNPPPVERLYSYNELEIDDVVEWVGHDNYLYIKTRLYQDKFGIIEVKKGARDALDAYRPCTLGNDVSVRQYRKIGRLKKVEINLTLE